MALGPDGSVYVSRPVAGEVVRLVDADGNGEAESQSVAVSGLNRPHGLAFHGGYLYIANTDGVVRVRVGANGQASGAAERVNTYNGGGGHWSRSIAFGADSAMYVAIGSTCNMCVEKSPDRAAVMRFDENGGNGRVFSSGLRNAVGIAMNPATKQIWVTQNERDNIEPDHEDLPPEEINILQDGGDYGWPYCYGNRIPSPDREFHDPARCARTIPPALGDAGPFRAVRHHVPRSGDDVSGRLARRRARGVPRLVEPVDADRGEARSVRIRERETGIVRGLHYRDGRARTAAAGAALST